jgi:hypothetical protein
MGYMPPIENPRTSNREIDRRLAEDSIDNLILTTCKYSFTDHILTIAGTTSLKQLHAAILASSVNVICIVHHSGPSLYHDVRPLIKPLIDQGRIQLVTLGGHVTRNARLEALDWSAMEHWDGWERLHIDTLLPVSSIWSCSIMSFGWIALTQRSSTIHRTLPEPILQYSPVTSSYKAMLSPRGENTRRSSKRSRRLCWVLDSNLTVIRH